MTVTAFRVQNFMGFEDSEWIELRPITVLFGRNSSGKSALIRALLLLEPIRITRMHENGQGSTPYSSSSSSRSARRRSSASKPGPSSPMSFRCWMISWALFSSSTCSSMNH